MIDPIVSTVPLTPVVTCANCGESIATESARVVAGDRATHHPECPTVPCPECKRPVHPPAIFKINRPGVPVLSVCPWCMADMVEWYRASRNAENIVPMNGKEPRGV